MVDPRRREAPEDDATLPEDDTVPEKELNRAILWRAFLYKVTSRSLAFLFATVVLLAGFATLIRYKDFWYVTIVMFMEAISMFASFGSGEDQIFNTISDAFVNEDLEKLEKILYDGDWNLKKILLPSWRIFLAYSYRTAIGCAHLLAVTTCIVLSYWRLKQHDFGDQDMHTDEGRNVRVSLYIFYGLVLAQGMLFLGAVWLRDPYLRMIRVWRKYNLGVGGMVAIYRYTKDNTTRCLFGNVREAMNMDLVIYAKDLAISTSARDQSFGLDIINRLLKSKYKKSVLMRLGSFPETVGRIVNMPGLKSPEEHDTRIHAARPEEQDTRRHAARERHRRHAARVVLELAPNLLVESFPGMLQFVSSLLAANMDQKKESIEFTELGVQILEKLTNDPDNCRRMKDADDLLPKLIDLTNDRENSTEKKEIVETSLKVLHKLVSTSGKTGKAFRSGIAQNVYIIRNIRRILEHADSHQKLAVEATRILACLALDEIAREQIGSSRRIIRKLVSMLLRPVENVEDCSEAAAEALLLLTTESESNVYTIFQEIKLEDMKNFLNMLSRESTEPRSTVAKLLENLHAYLGAEANDKLPMVLEAIIQGVQKLPDQHSADARKDLEELKTKVGRLLESFIGLNNQICAYLQPSDFTSALKCVNLPTFVAMLEKILDVYESPTTEFPGIRRVTVELMIWIMENNSSDIDDPPKDKMRKTLMEVAETATELEDFKLFYCGVGVSKHNEPISSLVNKSLALMGK